MRNFRSAGKEQKTVFITGFLLLMAVLLSLSRPEAEAFLGGIQAQPQAERAEGAAPVRDLFGGRPQNGTIDKTPGLFSDPAVPAVQKKKEAPTVFRFLLPDLNPAQKNKTKEKARNKTAGIKDTKDYPYAFNLVIGDAIYAGVVTRAGKVSVIQELIQAASTVNLSAKDKTTVKAKPEAVDVVEFAVDRKIDTYMLATIQILAAREQKAKWGFPVLLNDTTLTEKNIAAGFLLNWPLLREQKQLVMENLGKNKDTRLLKEYESKWKTSIETLLKKGDKDETLQGAVKELMAGGEKLALLIYSAVQKAGDEKDLNKAK